MITQLLMSRKRRVAQGQSLVQIFDLTVIKSPVDGWAGYTTNSDGNIWVNGNGSAWHDTGTPWKLSGAVGDYEGRHTVISGLILQFPNGGPDTWISLANNPYFQTDEPYYPSLVKYEIRLASTQEILATANITLVRS